MLAGSPSHWIGRHPAWQPFAPTASELPGSYALNMPVTKGGSFRLIAASRNQQVEGRLSRLPVITAYAVRWDLSDRSRQLRKHIRDWADSPICVWIGQTKIRAKPANYIANSVERKPGS